MLSISSLKASLQLLATKHQNYFYKVNIIDVTRTPTKGFRKQEIFTKHVHAVRTSNDLKQLRNER